MRLDLKFGDAYENRSRIYFNRDELEKWISDLIQQH